MTAAGSHLTLKFNIILKNLFTTKDAKDTKFPRDLEEFFIILRFVFFVIFVVF